MADTFFIYAPADAPRAQAIAAALAKAGLQVDWDRSLLPGERYATVIPPRLAAAKAAVVLWSNASINDSLIMDEAASARDGGKLMPVKIDAIDLPLGFRQLETGDLVGWPGRGQAAFASLAAAIAAVQGAPAPKIPVAPQPAYRPPGDLDLEAPMTSEENPRLLRSASFWGWTLALSTLCGLIYFLSPMGQADAGATTGERIGTLFGHLIVGFLAFGVGRALIFWSRLMVGKRPNAYLGAEMVVLLLIAVVLALFTAISPSGDKDYGTGFVGFANALNTMVMGVLFIGAPILFIFRGLVRLVRGKPRPA